MTIQTDMTGEAVILSADVELASLRDEAAALRNEVERLQTQLRGARRDHESDIRIIGERAITEAENRDFCGQFDDVISDLNQSLTIPLPEREREYEITVSGELRVPFVHTVTVLLRGRASDDEIQDAAREAMDNVTAQDVNTDDYGAEMIDWEVEDVNEA